MFRKMRAELAYMWNPSNRAKNLRRLSNRAGFQETEEDSHGVSSLDLPLSTYDNIDDLKVCAANKYLLLYLPLWLYIHSNL